MAFEQSRREQAEPDTLESRERETYDQIYVYRARLRQLPAQALCKTLSVMSSPYAYLPPDED